MSSRPAGPAGTVIRAPNHMGELVLALPALEAAADREPVPPAVQVPSDLAPVLEISGIELEVLPMPDRHALLREARRLRRRGATRGVLLTPSFSAALLFWMARIPVRRGTATDCRSWLLTDPVDRTPLLAGHRVREYLSLAAPSSRADLSSNGGGPPAPRLRPGPARQAVRDEAIRTLDIPAGSGDRRPVVGLVPGGRAPARRWPLERWIDLAARLSGQGADVLVFGGPGESERTARVAREAEVRDLGGRTDVPDLIGGLDACDVVVSNDTGPMHLAAALGRPVVVPWGAGDLRQTRPLSAHNRVIARTDLPCHPCMERECPRRGPGYRSARARRECLTLIGVDEVESAVRTAVREWKGSPRRRS